LTFTQVSTSAKLALTISTPTKIAIWVRRESFPETLPNPARKPAARRRTPVGEGISDFGCFASMRSGSSDCRRSRPNNHGPRQSVFNRENKSWLDMGRTSCQPLAERFRSIKSIGRERGSVETREMRLAFTRNTAAKSMAVELRAG